MTFPVVKTYEEAEALVQQGQGFQLDTGLSPSVRDEIRIKLGELYERRARTFLETDNFEMANIRGQLTRIPKPQSERDILRERFRRVIRMAGYARPERILGEYFDVYMNGDRAEFIAMLEDYEKKYAKDGEII